MNQHRSHEREEQIRQIEHRLAALRRIRLWLDIVMDELELMDARPDAAGH